MMSDDYKKGWYDGYHAAKTELNNVVSPKLEMPKEWTRCGVCGILVGGGPKGYVCPHNDCPSKATLGVINDKTR